MTKIPKTMYLYWGRNQPLSFMRYMTVKSFAVNNPYWKIWIIYPKNPIKGTPWGTHEQKGFKGKDDYFDWLKNIHNVHLEETEQFQNASSEVHRSDLIRVEKIYNYGGMWSDFDILYHKPIEEMKVPDYSDNILCFGSIKGKDFNSIGLFGAKKKTELFKQICQQSFYRNSTEQNFGYQWFGREVFDSVFMYTEENKKRWFDMYDEHISNMPFDTVYAYNHTMIHRIYLQGFDCLTDNSIGVHWYAGDMISSGFENQVTDKNIKDYVNVPLFKRMRYYYEI